VFGYMVRTGLSRFEGCGYKQREGAQFAILIGQLLSPDLFYKSRRPVPCTAKKTRHKPALSHARRYEPGGL